MAYAPSCGAGILAKELPNRAVGVRAALIIYTGSMAGCLLVDRLMLVDGLRCFWTSARRSVALVEDVILNALGGWGLASAGNVLLVVN